MSPEVKGLGSRLGTGHELYDVMSLCYRWSIPTTRKKSRTFETDGLIWVAEKFDRMRSHALSTRTESKVVPA